MPIPLTDFASEYLPSPLREDLILIVVLKPRPKVQTLKGAIFAKTAAIALEMAKSLKDDGGTARAIVVVEQ